MCKESILTKIKNLLNMTVENGCSESEALTALAKARSLMLKYKVEEKDLITTEEKDIIQMQLKYNSNVKWVHMLISIMADNYGVLTYVTYHGKIRNTVLFGLKTDVECVAELIKVAYDIADKAASKIATEYRELFGTAKGIKYSYFYGFVDGLKNKFDEQNKQEEYALMLQVDEDVKSEFTEFTKNFTQSTVTIKLNINDKIAYSKGFKEGNEFGTTKLKEGDNI